MDIITPLQRSVIMSRIRSKDTKPELHLRKELFKLGYRYRLHDKKMPARPDIVLPMYKTVIFVNGCFWHLHKVCRDGRLPKSRLEYWEPKLKRNVERDKLNYKKIKRLGWQVIIIWECEIRKNLTLVVNRVVKKLRG